MLQLHLPLPTGDSLLFLNGTPTASPLNVLTQHANYQHIIACDGAWNALATQTFAANIHAVLGDGDSLQHQPPHFMALPDQNATDFEKTLLWLIQQGSPSVDVYWASGGEMDHFLGNLSVAAKYHQQIICRFYDAKQCYFYLNESCQIQTAANRQISLYPFPAATVSSQGLRYEMTDYKLTVTERQSLRNRILSQRLTLQIDGGVFLFLAAT